MTSPCVTELPRRLEPVSPDTFLVDAATRLAVVAELRLQAETGRDVDRNQSRAG
ncbi:MAG: hypothetical protein QOD83_4255 [Solirubrobacteraceae bacterium]|jgi:hypothetical protein|nr:hypothetical protein [Solirubrobacteraceae bacterium]MEA2187214.1 hypothetical protein [Solirubrobacteraceae bacterium]MEA2234439.1 hypothetical protein [Solirubrobacteraceae bacterium]